MSLPRLSPVSLVTLVVWVMLALSPSTLRAQDLEPRNYSNLPVGLNFVAAGYVHTNGSVAVDSSSPLQDAEITTDTAVVGYARALNLWGDSGKFDVVVPYAWLEGTATYLGEPVSREVDGFGDPQVRLSWNFFGAPAMTLEELRKSPSDLVIGASLRVGVPLGQYDEKRLVNIGSNRWSFKPAAGLSKTWGPVILELEGTAAFFTDNDDFFGGHRREQEPIYAAQTHFIYNFDKGFWVGLDATYYTGGRTTIDGVEGDDRLESTRVGLTVGVPLSVHHSLKFYGSTGVTSRTGDEFTTLGVLWQYRWGAGL